MHALSILKITKFINYVGNLLVRMEISKQYMHTHTHGEQHSSSKKTAAGAATAQITGCVGLSEYSNGYKIIMIYYSTQLPPVGFLLSPIKKRQICKYGNLTRLLT